MSSDGIIRRGFYVEIRPGEWVRIAGVVELRRKPNRRMLLGTLRPSEDGKIMRIKVVAPGSLSIICGSAEEKVADGLIVKQKDFVLKSQDGVETHIIWVAGSAKVPQLPRASI